MTDDNSEKVVKLSAAVGRAITTWANIEFHLHSLLYASKACSAGTADAVWSDIKSFDAKVSVLRSILRASHGSSYLWRDLLLVLDEVMRLSGMRNKIAHGTMAEVNGDLKLRPYVAMGADRRRDLDIQEVDTASDDFLRLGSVLGWLVEGVATSQETTHSPHAPPEPELLLRLREADTRKQEAQRQRDQDAKIVERLRQAGKWPPPD